MSKLDSVIRRFLIGGFGGVRGPTIEETLRELRSHGFPDKAADHIIPILKELLNHRGRVNSSTVEETVKKLLAIRNSYQKEKKERRLNVPRS